MKYYIFGGNGFVGRYLANALLERDKRVVVCDLQSHIDKRINIGCEYIVVDICDRNILQQLPITSDDIVINMAANQYHTKVPRNRKEYFYSVNTEGTRNILSTVYEKGCRYYLMFTTDMTYGKPQYLPVDIRHPQNPFGPYGQSKKACEEICFEYRKKGMNITIMRPRMINGPGRLGILVKLFKLIDLNFPVPTIGSGKNHYQMISVFDCVTAILCAIDKGFPNKEYNLGSKESPDIRTLLKGVITIANSNSIVVPTPGRLVKFILNILDCIGLPLMYKEQFMIADEEYILDISETEKDLDWHPKYNDEEMLKEAYTIYKEKRKQKG
ncbi:NAD-dependent epimerase/dehydratase family protein [uncultured Bacteroides sp.]|uniref:NAD-dependent epimerase/dehydratase family protein n=1 Tax=uncultured Bacteroides sp. TaxID=162156 RepID=UPI0008226F45|nr:NAD(P)-dependent oxidoreductase [uncultured Bacteroides sp.]SCH60521.1 dTDP-glucose 4%2C6-dehydratase [uncultured Bacteroides sp.]